MKNNEKGFTLVELLAVIVILAILVVITIVAIGDNVEKSNAKALMVNADKYVNAVNDYATLTIKEDIKLEEGEFELADLDQSRIQLNGKKPSSGYVVLKDFEVIDACLIYDDYAVKFKNGKADSVVENGKCGESASYDYAFSYTGSEQTFTAPKTGVYKLEVWGAQGGYRTTEANGGKGAYVTGNVSLLKGDKLYVYVGSSGNNGSYNGGGTRGNDLPGGGGATDIRIKKSVLSRIIVAAGGGSDGAANRPGGYAGGETGGSATNGYGNGGGGATQTAGGSLRAIFSIGGSGTDANGGHGGGGGGGWYGGGGADPDGSSDDDKGGGGGSSYVYNETTAAYCPNGCLQEVKYYLSDTTMKAGNETFKSPSGIDETGHSGDGYAKITYLGVS